MKIRFEIQEYPNMALKDVLKYQPDSSLGKLRLLKQRYLK
jgi:hypothetical protein